MAGARGKAGGKLVRAGLRHLRKTRRRGPHHTPKPRHPGVVGNDRRLGPRHIVHRRVAGLTKNWKRYGGMSRKDFVDKYWEPGTATSPAHWRYPDHDGFATVPRGGKMVPDRHTETLLPGQRIDRFGPENGRFLSPDGTPFEDRALPPDSLTARPGDPVPHGYHRYQVVRPFQVSSGPVAPAFAQPGGGVQHYLDPSLYPPGADRNVEWLVKNGFLKRVGLGRA
jgi:hypothetical protein